MSIEAIPILNIGSAHPYLKVVSVKTGRDNDSFSNYPYRVQRDIFSKAIWKTNARYLLCLELTFVHEALVLIPKHLGDFTDLF